MRVQKILRLLFIAYFLFYISVVTATMVAAQDSTPSSPGMEVTSVSSQTFQGKVVRVESNVISVQSKNEIKEFTIPDTVSIKRNSFEAKPTDIQAGDEATITYTNTGQLLTIEVTSEKIADWSKMLIPALIIGILLIGLIMFIVNKSNKSHIKTTT